MRYGKLGLICTAAALMAALCVPTLAQAPQGGQGGGRQGRGQGGRGGGQLTVATIPASVLASELRLTADQKSKIAAIQTKLQADLKPLAFTPGAPPPDQQTMQENRQKRQELNAQATKDVEAVLTADQQAKLPEVMKGLQAYNAVGIPVGALADLNLTSDQKSKITQIAADAQKAQQGTMAEFQAARQAGDQAKIQELMQDQQKARQASHDKAVAVLTAGQKTALDAYMKAHPAPQFGGGFGGGGRQRPGAPPIQ